MLSSLTIVLLCAAASSPAPEEPQAAAPAVAVRFRGEPLLEIRAPSGKLSPAERAAAIESRLTAIAAHGGRENLDRIRIEERDDSVDLYVGDAFVLSVFDPDALPLGRTRQQVAADDALLLRRALDREYRERSLNGVLREVLLSLLFTLIVVMVVKAVLLLGPRMRARFELWTRAVVRFSRLDRLELLSGDRTGRLVARTGSALRVLIILAALFVYAGAVLSLYPWTRGYAVAMARNVIDALARAGTAVLAYLPNLLYIAIIVVATRAVLKLAHLFFHEVGRGTLSLRGFYPEWAEPTYKIARFLVLALTAIIVFPYLPGAHTPAFQGVSIFVGVLFSLGSSSAIGNIVAGVVLTYMRPFSIGDRVRIADSVGDVIEKNLLIVRIRTIKNVDVTVSNSAVLGSHIVNFSACARRSGLILNTSVTIGYDAPWRQVHALLIAAASSVEGVLREPAPFVLQTSLDDFYVSYEINCYTDRPNEMATLYSRLHQAIQDRFNAAGVEIMSPHYSALREGNAVAIPSEYLPKDYERPRFRVDTGKER